MDQRARIEPRDQWEKKLREKLKDYQAPIDQLPPLQLPAERQRKPLLWLVWGGSAVAAAVIILLLLLHQDNEPIDQLVQCTDGEIAKIVSISTVLAGLMSAIAVIGAKLSNNQQKTDQAWDWLKRIWLAWAVINGIGAFIAYVAPLFSGLATLTP